MKFIFSDIGNVIIPTDELIFFRGVETTNQETTWETYGNKIMKNIWKPYAQKNTLNESYEKKGRSTCQPVRIFACGGLGDVVLHHFGPAVFWCCFFVEGVDSFWCLCVCHHFLDLNIHFFYAKHCQVKTHTEMTYP
jgi:hypothetical protein